MIPFSPSPNSQIHGYPIVRKCGSRRN